MDISDKCVVAFHYTLTNASGETLDTSDGRDPLKYLHGAGNIVSGLEKAMNGKASGDEFKVEIKPEDGYGEVNPELIQKVPHAAFEGVQEVKPGMHMQAQGPDGQVQLITVTEVAEDGVTIDGNHPLAGQTLHFDVKIEEVREATEEEIEHGHAH